MASLLTQIEELHTNLPTKLSVDSIEVVWKVHRDSPNFRAVEAVVGLLIDELIGLASNPIYDEKIITLACNCLGAIGVYSTFKSQRYGKSSHLQVSCITNHNNEPERDRIVRCIYALNDPYILKPRVLAACTYTLRLLAEHPKTRRRKF